MSDFFPLILTMFWSVICLPIMLIGSIYILLWQFNGQEQIIVTPESITLQYEMFGRVRQATYSTTHITHFGTSNLLPASRTAPFLTRLRAAYGMEGGTLTFDYGSDTIHFGINLSEAEARQLIAEIKTTISPK
ncbi:MAG TPA: hypothetical protein VLL52_01890 [Anaerolineae bacterium]|nr:hypothetical protein [Anaerolineae bacterium]